MNFNFGGICATTNARVYMTIKNMQEEFWIVKNEF